MIKIRKRRTTLPNLIIIFSLLFYTIVSLQAALSFVAQSTICLKNDLANKMRIKSVVPFIGYKSIDFDMAKKRTSRLVQRKVEPFRGKRINTQLMGLFGLGGLEIAVICVGVGLVLGPKKIVAMIRGSVDNAGVYKNELLKIPEEFQKGYEQGQIEARSRKAKPADSIDSDFIDTNDEGEK
jgi:Sec-independent protein translocase protein TatA